MGGRPDLIRQRARSGAAADVAATLVVLVCRMLLGVVTALGALAVAPTLVGSPGTVVMSDSMAPGIRAGDVVVVRPLAAADLRIGQVLLVDDPTRGDRLRLHRLVALRDDGLVLRGDANPQPDAAAVPLDAVHGAGFLRVPWIGLPVLWARTGQAAPVVGSALLVVAAAVAVVVLDPGGRSRGPATASLLRVAGRLTRRAARSPAVPLVLVGAVVAAGAATASSSWAAFSATTAVRTNQLAVPTWPCPALPSPAGAPGIAYSFNPTSGTLEPNRGTAGAPFAARTSERATRVGGSCAPGATPSLRFPGRSDQALIGGTAIAASNPGTQTLWFSADAATGVLQSLGNGTAAGTDRQLYFTTGGRLAFAMRSTAGIVTCTIPVDVALGAWHFVSASWGGAGRAVSLSLDGAVTDCGTAVTSPSPAVSAPTRLGADLAMAPDASTAPFAGSMDEAYAWGAALTPAQIATVRSAGR